MLSSLLNLAHPHRLPGPPVALGFPFLSQEDTKGSFCPSRLLTLLSQIPSDLLPPIPMVRPPHRWGPMAPYVSYPGSCLCLPHPAHPLSQAFHLCILGRTLVAPDPVPLQNESCMSPSLYLLLPGYLLLHHHIPLSAMGVAFLN